jgi:hypothetical protein
VLVGTFVTSIKGTGVQVGGREIRVAVDVGITTVGGRVGGGNGFTDESGLIKITRNTAPTINAAAIRKIARISQMDILMPVSHLSAPHERSFLLSVYPTLGVCQVILLLP